MQQQVRWGEREGAGLCMCVFVRVVGVALGGRQEAVIGSQAWFGALPRRQQQQCGPGAGSLAWGGRASRTELQDIPFGMLVLEVLLDATAGAGVDRGGAGVLRVWNHGGGWRA